MYFIFCLLTVYFVDWIFATVVLEKVAMRIPKEHDIGLIFDLTLFNNNEPRKETLEFEVYAEGMCTLNLTNNEFMEDAYPLVGGHFGPVETGALKTISLIWPTVSLFNRVGSCPIIITSLSARNKCTEIRHLLKFDTRYATLDPDCNFWRKNKNYVDCDNWDLDYMRNCTPVDCEERYFGRRSFFNRTTKRCDRTPHCTAGGSQIYDFFANECVDLENYATESDLQDIRCGKYENNTLEFPCPTNPSEPLPQSDNAQLELIDEITDQFMHDGIGLSSTIHVPAESKRIVEREAAETVQMVQTAVKSPSPLPSPSPAVPVLVSKSAAIRSIKTSMPYWMPIILNTLLVIVATLIIYTVVCTLMISISNCTSSNESLNEMSCGLTVTESDELTEPEINIRSSRLLARH